MVSLHQIPRMLYKRTVNVQYVWSILILWEKRQFALGENKDADQLHGKSGSAPLFSLLGKYNPSSSFKNPKFPTSSRPLWLYSPVRVGRVQNNCVCFLMRRLK